MITSVTYITTGRTSDNYGAWSWALVFLDRAKCIRATPSLRPRAETSVPFCVVEIAYGHLLNIWLCVAVDLPLNIPKSTGWMLQLH